MSTMKTLVDHITRVEGHGNITAAIREGRIEEAMFQVVEANRLFEGIVRGRSFEEVLHITSRICGICAVSHCCAALKAIENALEIEISQQTKLLRRLMLNGEQLSSHALHVYFLAAPDFLGSDSVLPLIKEDPELVRMAFRVKKTAYDIGGLVAGRHTHPVAVVTGGFTAIPSAKTLKTLEERLVGLREDLHQTVDFYQKLQIPDFQRDTEYVCLRHPQYYSFYDGQIATSDGDALPAERYAEATNEYVISHSTAKYAKWHRESYMVGALARVNNNWQQLRPEAQEAMAVLGLKPPCANPFMNTIAQLVEMVHCLEDSIATIGEILDRPLREEQEPRVTPRIGQGIGAVEAPRGLLIHDYTFDENGHCVKANCVIPTGQNLASLNADMQAYLGQIRDRPEGEIRNKLEMLVRAYDPCISCSTH